MAVDALELTGLRRTFGDIVALDGLTFAVPPGTLFGFVGPNGAGKTTTMRIVCGPLPADEGRVTWRGEVIAYARDGAPIWVQSRDLGFLGIHRDVSERKGRRRRGGRSRARSR